jgi:hypothetical protein
MQNHLCFQYDHCRACLLKVPIHYYWPLLLVYHHYMYHYDSITCTCRPYFMPAFCVPTCVHAPSNSHHFFIPAISFSVQHPLADVVLSYLLTSDGNIILINVFFIYDNVSGTQLGCKTRPWCTFNFWSVAIILLGCCSMQKGFTVL